MKMIHDVLKKDYYYSVIIITEEDFESKRF